MARLNETEMLIQNAAKKLTPLDAKAFNKLIEFYEDLDYLNGGNDLQLINALYCTDHNVIPFEIIALNLGTSVSRLEHKRKDFQKIFLRHYERLKRQGSAAA